MQPAELRWAGGTLALGGSIFVLGVVLGLRTFGGEWDTTLGSSLPQTAELIRTKWPEFRIIWSGELLGALLLAIAALLLQRRRQERRRWLPAAVAWAAVGVGSLLVAVAYAITLGSYPHALAVFSDQPALFAALRGTTLAMHATGSVVQLLGLIGALSIEFRWQGRALPDRIVQAAAGVALLGSVSALAGLLPGEYVAAAIFAGTALLGAAIWQRADESAQRPRSLTDISALVAATTSLAAFSTGAHAQHAQPILDMHMHAMAAAAQGPPPRGTCAPFSRLSAFDPGSSQRAELMAVLMQPSSPAMKRLCDDVLWSPVTDADVIRQAVAVMKRRNVFGVLGGSPSRVAAWQAAAPDRFIPGLQFDLARDILYNNAARFLRLSEDEVRRHHGSRPGSPTATSARNVESNVLAITRANVVDVASGNILANRTILIRDGHVADVGASDSVAVPADAMRVDAAGQYLMPGLWDAHVHSATSAEWHFPMFIGHGITSVRNMHTSVDTGLALTRALKRRIASGELAGPRFLANGGVVDGRAAIWPGSVTVENAEAARAAVDSLVDGGADFIKVYDRLSAQAFDGIMAAARARGIAVDGHAPMAVDPVHAASSGMRTVEHGTGIVMGCSSRADSLRTAHEEHRRTVGAEGGAAFFRLMQTARDTRDPAACERTVRAFVQHGVAVTPTLVDLIGARVLAETEDMRHVPAAVTARWTAMAQSGPDPSTEFLEAGRDMRMGNVRMMHEAGVTILAGTDVGNPFIVPGASLHRELEILVRDIGMSPLEALRTATLNPARVFGLGDSLGSVAPGMRADLVLLGENPLDDIRNTRTIMGVVLDGRHFDRRELDALLAAAARSGR